MSEYKNQHYVSEGILKHFADTNKKAYEIYMPKKIVSKKNISDTMSQNYVYEHPLLKKNSLEKSFGAIENKVFPILDKLITAIDSNKKNDCQYVLETIKGILPFLLIFYFRSGALLNEYTFNSDTENLKLDRVERMLTNIIDKQYLFELSKTILNCYDIAVIVDDKKRFVISDQYLSTVALKYKNKFSNASNRQIGMKETMLLLPLSAKYYVVFFSGNVPKYIQKNTFNYIEDSALQEINDVIYQNSYVKCVGISEEEINRLKGKNFSLFSPTKTIMKYEDGTIADRITKREVFIYDIDKDLEINSINYMNEYIVKIKGQVNRNDKCICGSGKKYKHCCMPKYERVKEIMNGIKNPKSVDYSIPNALRLEDSITVFIGNEEDLNNEYDKEVLKKIEEIVRENENKTIQL